MAQLENFKSLNTKLSAMAATSKQGDKTCCVVSYTQAYGIYVHENLEAYHKVGQAKFLEQPARTEQAKMADLVTRTVKAGQPLSAGLLMAGLYLQRCSQKLCPVDTSALKNSANTQLEPLPGGQSQS